MTTITACPVCESHAFATFQSCIDYTVSQETFHLVRCTSCGFIMTSPRPTDERIGSYYVSDKYISHTNKAASVIDKVYLLARNYTLQWKLDLVNSALSGRQKKILDYGCGTGEFLKKCQDDHWQVSGVEPSSSARQQSSLLTGAVIAEKIQELPEKDFNVITLWHVLEHVSDPNGIITEIKKRLTQDGTIFIAVPNYKSWDGSHYKEFWAGYDVPRHLWHFSQQTMKALIEKNSLKLNRIIPMKLDSFYVSMLSEKYKNNNSSAAGILKAIVNGIKSNWRARNDQEYSSLLYVIKK
jgi:2-polyprenyl-3-methyl-5-hydroxy-6-metoxy-1,4-benzoquinol methylase